MTAAGRAAIVAVAAAWGAMGVEGAVRRLAGLAAAWPLASAPAAVRAAVETGDSALHGFLGEARARLGGARGALVLAPDEGGPAPFYGYRAAWALWPVRVRFAVAARPPEPGGPVALPAELAGEVAAGRLDAGGWLDATGQGRHRWFSLRVAGPGRVAAAPAPAPVPVPEAPRPSAFRWLLALAALPALGLGLSALVGLDAAFRDRLGARLALGLLLGCGGTGWLMAALSLAGVPWSVPAVLLAWAPAVGLGWRRIAWFPGARPRARGARPAAAALAGLAVACAGCAVAFAQALLPAPAWTDWDAWASWGFRARMFLDARGLPWEAMADPAWRFVHPEYPPAWPATQAWLGLAAGGTEEHWFQWLTAAHLPALLALFAALLADLGVHASARAWLSAGLAWLPKVQGSAAIGYVDVPAACWLLAGLLGLLRAGRGAAPGWTGGLLAGLAALHKPEAVGWTAGVLLVLAVRARGSRRRRRAFAGAAAAVALTAGAWSLVPASMGLGPRDFEAGPGRPVEPAGIRIAARVPLITRGLVLEAVGPGATEAALREGGRWDAGAVHGRLVRSWGALWLAVAVWGWLGRRRMLRPPLRALAATAGCQLLAVVGGWLAWTLPLAEHLPRTAGRMLLQVAPAALALAAGAALGTRRRGGGAVGSDPARRLGAAGASRVQIR